MALFLKLIVAAVGATALTAAFGINETRSWEVSSCAVPYAASSRASEC